jgi:hypothetical protein
MNLKETGRFLKKIILHKTLFLTIDGYDKGTMLKKPADIENYSPRTLIDSLTLLW